MVPLAALTAGNTANAAPAAHLQNLKGFHAQFIYSGARMFQVPPETTEITVTVIGAAGGTGYSDGSGTVGMPGPGAKVTATLAVHPGELLQVNVGGAGANGTGLGSGAPTESFCPGFYHPGGKGGFNGGGNGGRTLGSFGGSGGGGGASDIRTAPYGLADRLVVAGGGGGSAGRVAIFGSTLYGSGGLGGAPDGTAGQAGMGDYFKPTGGGGATTTEGGAGGDSRSRVGHGAATAGTLGQGGAGGGFDGVCNFITAGNAGGAGGGGGLYGGGGGGDAYYIGAGGGGGSSYGPAGSIYQASAQGHGAPGDGTVIIRGERPTAPN